ncbi:MAG: hypothetical protein IT180_19000 [Acidobacteria bacterium]|nr:hypothetical protein [Acidobacteriota bacterium]
MPISITIHQDERDVALEHLAYDEALLRERVAELEADVVAYRALLHQALGVAHNLITDRDRLRDRYHAALDEARRLRADLATDRTRRAA